MQDSSAGQSVMQNSSQILSRPVPHMPFQFSSRGFIPNFNFLQARGPQIGSVVPSESTSGFAAYHTDTASVDAASAPVQTTSIPKTPQGRKLTSSPST